MKKVLSIAGSDCSGGAGIQADIKTISAHKMYAMTVITALTAQNTVGVFAVEESAPDFVAKQIDAIFEDIIPDAIKIGMVSNINIIKVIAQGLKKHNAKNIVLDPVMVATSGGKLMKDDAAKALSDELFPLARVITPNIPEAVVLSGIEINNKSDMKNVALKIHKDFNVAVLLKGGHLADSSDDILVENGVFQWFESERIDTKNTHGTGCTLSSAIACGLADGMDLATSVKTAKEYITGALKSGLSLGKGSGPLNHFWNIKINEF